MADTLTLMAVHAHPDDESSSTGGVLAMYSDEGIRTVVVTCTNGEFGDAPGGIKPGADGHDPGEVAREPGRRGRHERAMERRAHREELGARLPRRHERDEPGDRSSMAGHDHLPAAVQVRRHDDVALRRFRAERRDGNEDRQGQETGANGHVGSFGRRGKPVGSCIHDTSRLTMLTALS